MKERDKKEKKDVKDVEKMKQQDTELSAEEQSVQEPAEEAKEETPEQKQIRELTEQLEQARKQSEEYLDRLRRSMAEFDNFRKRTEKEKEQEKTKGVLEVISTVLPLLDNFERALASIPEEEKQNATAKGVEMMYQQFLGALKAIGVEEIPAEGEPFDPNKHNAVTHIEDEKMDENIVCEVFQKGYSYKGQVVRYSMVKVAN